MDKWILHPLFGVSSPSAYPTPTLIFQGFSEKLMTVYDMKTFLCDSEDIITSFIKNSTLTESNVWYLK